MAIPAGFALACHGHIVVDPFGVDKFGIQLRVATDAVIHNDFRAFVDRLDHLGFAAHHENGGVAHTVHSLEEPFLRSILVWHMAIVAGGITAV